jgi:hypothetical protein
MTITDQLARIWFTTVLGIPLGSPDGSLPCEQQPGELNPDRARCFGPAGQVNDIHGELN